jgi:hypothetical protein
MIEKSPGKYSMSLTQYISQFQSNIATSKVTDESTLCHYFSSGIPPSLSGKIYLMEKVPTTIAEWYSHTQRIDDQQCRAFLTSQQYKRRSFINSFTPTYSTSTKERDPNGMDINAVRIPKLTPAERERCFKQGLCLCCRKAGHNASSCSTFSTNPSSFKGTTRKVAKAEEEDLPKLEEIEDDDEDEKVIGKASFSLDF